jgi:hypothetical protein
MIIYSLQLLRNNSLENSGIQGASRKARRLMLKLITMTNVVPGSLFITANIRTEIELQGTMAIGGFGSIFKGNYAGQPVALKVLIKARHPEVSKTPSTS